MDIRTSWHRFWRPPILAEATAATGADRLGNASQDAGWAHLVSADGSVTFGRGHLKMWMERPGSPLPNGRQAQLDSFTPGETEPNAGDRAGIRPEAEGSSVYPVIIREYERSGNVTSVLLDWVEDDQLPAILLETGGERSGEKNITADP